MDKSLVVTAIVVVLYLSLSLWFATTVFLTYTSTSNVTKYITEVLSVIEGRRLSSIAQPLATSP